MKETLNLTYFKREAAKMKFSWFPSSLEIDFMK